MQPSLRLAYYGDDFTGSTDALEFLTRAGLRTVLFIDYPTPEKLARYPGLQALGLAGLSRSKSPADMEAELRPAFTALRTLGAPHVHYKVCSTFDSSPKTGSIGRAIDIGASIFNAPFVPLLVGAPALGRHCVFGNLFARMGIGSAGEIHRLDRHPSMSKHPVTPADESDLRLHLAKQTAKKIALFDILQLDLPAAECRASFDKLLSSSPDIVLFDLLYANQLARIGSLIDAHATPSNPLFSVGSSGIEMALGAHWSTSSEISNSKSQISPSPQIETQKSQIENPPPLLVLSGSCSPITAAQIEHAIAQGFAAIPLETELLGATNPVPLRNAIDAAAKNLRNGRHTIIYTSRGQTDSRVRDLQSASPGLLGAYLGTIGRELIKQIPLRRVLLAGGDTSSYAATTLGIEALEMIAPLAPGAPLCRAHSTDPQIQNLEINFKGGQVGPPDYFSTVANFGTVASRV